VRPHGGHTETKARSFGQLAPRQTELNANSNSDSNSNWTPNLIFRPLCFCENCLQLADQNELVSQLELRRLARNCHSATHNCPSSFFPLAKQNHLSKRTLAAHFRLLCTTSTGLDQCLDQCLARTQSAPKGKGVKVDTSRRDNLQERQPSRPLERGVSKLGL